MIAKKKKKRLKIKHKKKLSRLNKSNLNKYKILVTKIRKNWKN